MATVEVEVCDRCGAVCRVPNKVDGRDVCEKCCASFVKWWEAPRAPPKTRKRPRTGAVIATVRAIYDENKRVDAVLYAAKTGVPYRKAYWTIRYLARKGALVKVKGNTYRLKEAA